MSEDKTTAKDSRKASTEKPPIDFAVIWDKLKQNPAVIISIAGLFGVSAGEARGILEAEIPAWVAILVGSALPLLYAALARMKAGLTAQKELIGEVRGMRKDLSQVRDELAAGSIRFDEHSGILDEYGVRIGLIENTLRAEIAAYQEKTTRETGKVAKEDPSTGPRAGDGA